MQVAVCTMNPVFTILPTPPPPILSQHGSKKQKETGKDQKTKAFHIKASLPGLEGRAQGGLGRRGGQLAGRGAQRPRFADETLAGQASNDSCFCNKSSRRHDILKHKAARWV